MRTITEFQLQDNHFLSEWRRMQDHIEADVAPHTLRAIQRVLETSLELEVTDLVGGGRWSRVGMRPYRNGSYLRSWWTGVGHIPDLRVPRLRQPMPFRTLPRYQRRATAVDAAVRAMFLAGVATRRVHEVLGELLGAQRVLSATTVSRLAKTLDTDVQRFHARALPDTIRYLLLDGLYLKVKSPRRSVRRCVLVAYGITAAGQRELLDFRLTPQGESEAAWSAFLTSLVTRGLTGAGLRLVVTDGHKGLHNALDLVWPDVPRQLCWAHKLRNVANALPRRLHPSCLREAKRIPHATSAADARRRFRCWRARWLREAPKAVACVERDLEHLLPVFQEPPALWAKLRTTNAIERVFREVRRRIRPMSCFQNPASVARIIFAIFYRQNRLWREKPLWQITQKS